ncbi:hypothetical protein FS842_000302, partial [Serendipita sp. 407]
RLRDGLYSTQSVIVRSPRPNKRGTASQGVVQEEEEEEELPSLDMRIAEQEQQHPSSEPGRITYPADLLPGFDHNLFSSPRDIVAIQQPVLDQDDRPVKPWNLENVLLLNTPVIAKVILCSWIIGNKAVCQAVATKIEVVHRDGPPTYYVPVDTQVTEDITADPFASSAIDSNSAGPSTSTTGLRLVQVH